MSRAHQITRALRRGAMVSGRRARVAELLVRGNTKHQIYDEMVAGGKYINPKTDAPWSYDTLRADIKKIRERWEAEVRLNYDIHVSRILGQIRAVRKAAWKEMRLETILKTLDQEVKILGLDKIAKEELDWKREMREIGVDPAETFEGLVQSTYEKMMVAGEVQVLEEGEEG